jgi:cytochrome c oxidase assembly factor CtaG
MSRNLNRSSLPAAAAIGMALTPLNLFAHTGRPLAPSSLWSAWTLEPVVIVLLAASAACYARGVARIWAAADTGAGVRVWRVVAFALGWIALAVALVSPLHALGGALFSAHMVQHEILISIAAPLLVLGNPIIPFLWALAPARRRVLGKWSRGRIVSRGWNLLTVPSVAFALHAIALWVWHLPGPYQASLTSDLVHSLQHGSFLITALLFWWTILGAHRGELARGRATLYLFATALQTGALGALLTFAPSLWYPAYAATTAQWGLTPLDDQQLGGLIMWIPGSIAYLMAALTIFAEWLGESERRALRYAARITATASRRPAS